MKGLASQQRLQSETSVADFIPYSHHVTAIIIATLSGDYLAVWHLGGRTLTLSSPQPPSAFYGSPADATHYL